MSKPDYTAEVARAKRLMTEGGLSQRKAAAQVGMPQSVLSETLKREGFTAAPAPGGEASGVERNGEDVTITSPPTAQAPTAPPDQRTGEELLRKHGYDPEQYVITSVRVSEWGDPESPMFQHRVNARRMDNFLILPDFNKGDFVPFDYGQIEKPAERRVALIPDLHAPFENELAVGAALDFIVAEQPEEIILLGDLGDHTRLSKHRTHPRFNAMLNDTLDRVAQNNRRIREAAEDARIVFVPGNHDDRVLYYSREVGGELAEVRPGKLYDDEQTPNTSLGYRELYRLDDLGIELVDEDWKLAEHRVAPELSARHGYLTGNNSERKLLETHGRSQIHAHDHRGTITYRTKHDPLDICVVMSCGTLSQVEPDGLGYQPDPDWTPGMGWAHIWDSGLFHLSFVPFVDNKLLTPWGMAFEGRTYA